MLPTRTELMKLLKFLLIVCIMQQVWSNSPKGEKTFYNVTNSRKLFTKYVKKFDKKYNGAEYKRHLEYFKKSLKYINKLNKANSSAVFGITPFADMSRRKIKKLAKKRCLNDIKTTRTTVRKMTFRNNTKLNSQNIPKRWDWIEHKAVTISENQGRCGCCWAFAAAGAVEGRYAVVHKKLKGVSVQQMLDCSTDDNNCRGGYPEDSLRIIRDFGGLVSRFDYPYTQTRGKCQQWDKKIEVEIDDVDIVYVPTEDHLKHLIYTHGPIAAGMQTGDSFFYYKDGIVTGHELDCEVGKHITHAVVIVGYGGGTIISLQTNLHMSEPGSEYWVVKNSFGKNWGQAGFMFLARNVSPGHSQCAITEYLVQVHVL